MPQSSHYASPMLTFPDALSTLQACCWLVHILILLLGLPSACFSGLLSLRPRSTIAERPCLTTCMQTGGPSGPRLSLSILFTCFTASIKSWSLLSCSITVQPLPTEHLCYPQALQQQGCDPDDHTLLTTTLPVPGETLPCPHSTNTRWIINELS